MCECLRNLSSTPIESFNMDPFSLPFTEGSHPLNSGHQNLEGEWREGMPPPIPLTEALRKIFLSPFELHFWLEMMTTWPTCSNWQNPLHSYSSFFFPGHFWDNIFSAAAWLFFA